jgi:hypothetical protein
MSGSTPPGVTVVERRGSETPDVSVIIPMFNRAKLVADAVASAVEQSGRFRVEIVAVDDGSADGSLELAIAAGASASGLVAIRQTNAGPAAARNTGIRHARGRFLSFLDSDDRLVAGKIDRQMALLDRDRSADLCVGRWGWYDETFRRLIASFGPRRARTWPILPCFLRNEHFPVATALFRRDAVTNAPPWPEAMRNWEDHVWMIGIGLRGARSIHLPEEVLQVREHGGSRASAISNARALDAESTFARALLAFDWPADADLRDALAERLLVVAQSLATAGRDDEGDALVQLALAGQLRSSSRQALRAFWAATKASPRTVEFCKKTTGRLIGLRTRVRWHLPDRAWQSTPLLG